MNLIIPSTEISDRRDFALLCNARNLGVAVEIGVELGVNAKCFLDRWHGRLMLLIDHYPNNNPIGWMDRSVEMMICVQALQAHHGRYYLIRGESLRIAENYPHWLGMPQFVYLDGGHEYQDIKTDIAAWWERLEPEGILAGHDYDDELPGVKQAVNEFSEQHNAIVRLTHERKLKSWYAYKTEPKELIGVSSNMKRRSENLQAR